VQLKLTAATRSKLAARNLDITAYQPVALFRGPRKLSLVPEPGDPWRVTLRHKGMCSWADGSLVGHGEADTLEDAIALALGPGDTLGAISRLGDALDALTAVLRA
jgi:hypothetical protein